MIDKDSLPLDKPRRTPSHPTKSHVVKTRVDGKEKIIRFGEQGASTAGKPKEGESEAMKQKRASFKARHAKNIAKGKSSPAYWANKTKWATGGSVELEDLDEQYAGIKKPDFKMLESFKDLIRTLQARAEDSGTQEFDPVRALGRSGAAGSLEDLYEAYSDKPAPHASKAEAGAKDPKRTETAKMVFDSFKNAGFSDAQAKALTAEINREGSFNPAYLFGSHTDAANKATNVGMLSWQGDRANRLMSFMADRGLIDPAGRIAPGQDALNAQAEYLRWEMENDPSYTRTRETFLANPDIDQETAHDILGKNFIRWRIDDPKYRGSGFERISEGYDLLNMAQGYAEGGLAELAHKYDKGGKKKDDEDELARAVRLRDLELMAEPKNPKAVPAEDPRLLNVGGLEERLAFLNQTLNPVEAIGDAMSAGRDLMASEAGGYDRLEALGRMLSGVAGVAGPAAVAKRIGAPAASAVADMARKYAIDEAGSLPGMGRGLPEPRTEAEDIAREILQLRAEGRSDEVTDAMMNAADPQYMYYNTPLPMDAASREARMRASYRGDLYSGTGEDFPAFDDRAVYASTNPDLAYTYAPSDGGIIMPLAMRAKHGAPVVDAGGKNWNKLNPTMRVGGDNALPIPDDIVPRDIKSFNEFPMSTRDYEEAARRAGFSGVTFDDIVDVGGYFSKARPKIGTPEYEAHINYLHSATKPTTVEARFYPNQVRSRFARFDPEFAHLRNLSAGVAAGAIGASQYDPDAIETTAARVRENKFAAGGAVKYDPAAVDGIINKLREVNRG